MRLFGRNDIVLLGCLAVALFVLFNQPLQQMFDFVREIEDTYQVRLLPALMILVGTFIFHQFRKREEARVAALTSAAAAAEATARSEEMGRRLPARSPKNRSRRLRSLMFRNWRQRARRGRWHGATDSGARS